MKFLKILLFPLLLVVFALPLAAKEMTAEKVAKKTKVKEAPDDEIIEFIGPDIQSFLTDPYYFRSFMSKEGIAAHFVIVEYDFLKAKGASNGNIYRNADSLFKKFYVSEDAEGNEFHTEVYHTDVGCSDGNSFCDFEEYFRIDLEEKYLRSHVNSGITLYARSRAGPAYKVYFYPAYIKGFLAKMDAVRAKYGVN